MKQISKTLKNQYQSRYGLMADKKECQRLRKKYDEIRHFDICQRDMAPGLHIPEKLFSREKELEILQSAFERTSAGKKETFMVEGRASEKPA